MFHNKFGRKISSATPPPASSHGVHKSFRCGVSSNPSSSAAAKNPIEYLFSRPNPPIAPNAIHKPHVAGANHAQQHERASRPEQRLKRIHRKLMIDHDPNRREPPRAPPSARCRISSLRVRARTPPSRKSVAQPGQRRPKQQRAQGSAQAYAAPPTQAPQSTAADRHIPNRDVPSKPGNTARRENIRTASP